MNIDWNEFLASWNRDVFDDSLRREQLPPDVVQRGWLGYPPASAAEIAKLETRLGTMLPASYRGFLLASNGWLYPTRFIYRIWSTNEADWLRIRNQAWIDAYVQSGAQTATDAEYFVYGASQLSVNFRAEYLTTALEISEEGDSAIYLLNPRVIADDGEWEAWFFANWLPGAVRYRSFQEMMVAARATDE